MDIKEQTNQEIEALIKGGQKLPFATENYPSRGQTTVQELYQTKEGKFFLKRVSERNHIECQINIGSGTLAEREFWAYRLANEIGLLVPPLWLIDKLTTVQQWFDYPDGRTFKKSTGKMELVLENIFDCVIFDWVTGQIDRHDANYLYNYGGKEIIPIDSAHSFLKYEGSLPDYLHLFEIGSPALLNKKVRSSVSAKLAEITEDKLRTIVSLRDEAEFCSFCARRDVLRKISTISDILNLFRRK